MTMMTLEEVLRTGQGSERPFRCHVHQDSNASASVNVDKGVWFCFSCGAKGTTGTKRVPSLEDLQAMMTEESVARIYPRSYLQLFRSEECYWHRRFPDWLVRAANLGHDPFTGHATFPVYDQSGNLAGVGRRDPDPEAKPRYKYPRGWSASRVLHGHDQKRHDVLVLVEGAADQVSLQEVGIYARGCYGAGLHQPQINLVLKVNPKIIVLGFDMDEAGTKAAGNTAELLADSGIPLVRAQWPAGDPADCTPAQRKEAVTSVVGQGYAAQWQARVASHQIIKRP